MKESKPKVFICHASEDKETVVRPIKDAFNKAGIEFWIDEEQIGWGESLIQKVNEGIISSTYILVVLSMNFQKKEWPKREFYAMLNDETTSGIIKVLPLIVGTDSEKAEIIRLNRLICDKKYLTWTGRPNPIVKELLTLLAPGGGPASHSLSRVCFISSEFPPNILGGLGVHVDNLATALGSYVDVDVVLPFHKGYDCTSQRVRSWPMAKVRPDYDDPISWLYFAHHVPEQIRSIGIPDVIHCHDWVTILGGIKSKWLYKVPLIFHIHLPNRSPLCASIENLGLICADLITVCSQAMREELLDRFPTLRIEVIPNGVDTQTYVPASERTVDDGHLLFVGRLVEQKGVEYLLRAMNYIKEQFPSIHLKIVGEGPLRPALENFSSNFVLSDQVEFLGWKSGKALIELYQTARIVVVPSIYEPFGMTALEAMACRKPVVASRVGGLQAIIKHGHTGYFAEPRDHLDLAQWIMALLSNPELCCQMGEKALLCARDEKYQWSSIACKYIEFYNELLKEELDLSINQEAEKFKTQIASVAAEITPALGVKPTKFLDSLFNWMVN
jgi:glycosyltransferase involved in cell wall biosynthesis